MELLRANQAAEAGDDPLAVALKCLVEVLQFIDADRAVKNAALTRPLGILANAMHDLLEGGHPSFFFDRPKNKRGRPAAKNSFEHAKGIIAAHVELLIQNGKDRNEAARDVATELENDGIRMPNGAAISADHVLRWREEQGATASPLAATAYKDALRQRRTQGLGKGLLAKGFS